MKPLFRFLWVYPVFCLFLPALSAAQSQPTTLTTEIKISGITTILGDKRVMLVVREPAQAGQTSGSQYNCTLSEGQSSGAIKVIEVDEKSERVKILNGENEMELTMARNGVPMPVAPARSAVCATTYAYTPQPAVYYSAPQCVAPASQVIVVGQSCGSSYRPAYSRIGSIRSFGYTGNSYGSCSTPVVIRGGYSRSYCPPVSVSSCGVSAPACRTVSSGYVQGGYSRGSRHR